MDGWRRKASSRQEVRLKIYCKSCSFATNKLYCSIVEHDKMHECPCITCLVKAMCRDQLICKIRVDYVIDHVRMRSPFK